MEKIIIKESSAEYSIHIEKNILLKLANYISTNRKIFILCDSIVYQYYINKISVWFDKYDYKIYKLVSNEENKSMGTVQSIVDFLLENHCVKDSTLLALGGGVIGDITGFIASIYYRGIDYIQIPTTFLSMVDSCAGGKTAINWGYLKNIIGSFYSPKFVLIDPNFILTLDQKHINNGYAEVIKYGFIFNKNILSLLRLQDLNYTEIIKQSLLTKKYFVEKDFYDLNIRRTLNFGHTIGHSIEQEYHLLHGYAIGLGMVYAVKLGIKLKITKPGVLNELLFYLDKFNLRTDIKNFFLEKNIAYDKKNNQDFIDYILIEEIGRAIIKKLKIEEVSL